MSYEELYHNYGGTEPTDIAPDPELEPETTDINATNNEVTSNGSEASSGNSNPLPSVTEAEALLDMIRLNSINYSDYHNQKYHRYKYLYYYCQVPIIVLSACSAFISSATQQHLSQSTITIITTSVSLCIGIITSLNLFFNVQGNTEAERIAHKKYYMLSVEIMHMLYLQKGKRDVDLNLFVNQKLQDYLRINASSGVITEELDDLLMPHHPIIIRTAGKRPMKKFKHVITKICRPQKYRRNKQHKQIQRAGLELLQFQLVSGADAQSNLPMPSPAQTPVIRSSVNRVYPQSTTPIH